ncbi:MAG: GreA/GreB family elongation factor, partial [Candidatus Cloacimonadaceae bacterium]|nr:GreA/GreB family elongation factor [Candidatus Cloacimonadaceae bacterium]
RLKVVDVSAIPKDTVRFGSTCHTIDEQTGEQIWFEILGVDELNFHDDPDLQAVSVLSPIGKALLGKKPGEIAIVKAPMGDRFLKILQIK